ncbi:hypothetical protein GPJ56_004487 [Histomonas meleagridis]|uniref:uncharacterized protein n=1 Tax=Histomonas meleagridis TaxID=135588 RepID=UPI00355A81B8|nr:hypothetical protein GPJ56_004487 [Histomonas meleagridis]KAH0801985.1 hypothetical protein GO595_005066 [Histomonas meleagridis]
MKQIISGFNNKEKELWNQLYAPRIAEISEKSPDVPISVCNNLVYQEFILRKWELKVKEKSPIVLSLSDYNAIPDNYGPDLTAIPRARYQNVKQQKTKESSPKKPTPYTNFVRIWSKEHPEIDYTQRFKQAGKAWQALTEEEKASYADKITD